MWSATWTTAGWVPRCKTAFAASTGDVVVVIDCDLSYSPEHIPRLVDALVQGQAKIAIASPYMAGGATIGVPRHIGRRSRLANRFLSSAVHGEIETLTGMVRAYDGEFIRGLALKAPDGDINLETIYKTMILRGRIVEIPAVLDWSGLASRAGRARMADARTRFKVYKTLLDGVLFRPYVLFAIVGVILLAGGAAVGLFELLVAAYVELTVLCICALTTGLMLCFAGLLSFQVKRCFEELFFLGARDRVGATVLETRALRSSRRPTPRCRNRLRPRRPCGPSPRPWRRFPCRRLRTTPTAHAACSADGDAR